MSCPFQSTQQIQTNQQPKHAHTHDHNTNETALREHERLCPACAQARWSAVILAAALGLSNLWMFPYWTVRACPDPSRGGSDRTRAQSGREVQA
jgi:hypothetical protein